VPQLLPRMCLILLVREIRARAGKGYHKGYPRRRCIYPLDFLFSRGHKMRKSKRKKPIMYSGAYC